jgi:rhodanese-related sulfurtransferase
MIFGFNEPSVPTVAAEIVKKFIDSKTNCVIIDVRTPPEYMRGKIEGSLNIPVDEIDDKAKTMLTDQSQKIYVYCLSGARSTVAVEKLIKLGYTNVFHMDHSLLGWRAKYFPVIT